MLGSYLPLLLSGGASIVLLSIVWAISRRRRTVTVPAGALALPAVEIPPTRRRLAKGSIAFSAQTPAQTPIPMTERRSSLRPSHARR